MKNALQLYGRGRLAVLTLILLTHVQGCSFQSNQFNALKAIFAETEAVTSMDWTLAAGAADIVVYPIQAEEGVIFSDGKTIFIKFDGWHIVGVTGFEAVERERPLGIAKRIELRYETRDAGHVEAKGKGALIGDEAENEFEVEAEEGAGLRLDGDTLRYDVYCRPWQRSAARTGHQFSQSCAFSGGDRYSNVIEIDPAGNISNISALVHPSGLRINLSPAAVRF